MNKVSKMRKSEQPRVKRWEQAVFKRDNYNCQLRLCTAHYLSTKIDAHHIWEKGPNRQWKFVLENGITLCRVCHGLVHDDWALLLKIGIDRDALKEEFNRDVGTIIT